MLQFQITLLVVLKYLCLQLLSRIYLHLDRPLHFLLLKLYVLNPLLCPLSLINKIMHIHILLNAYIRLLQLHITNCNLFLLLSHLLLFPCHILLLLVLMHPCPTLMFIQILLIQIPIFLFLPILCPLLKMYLFLMGSMTGDPGTLRFAL